MCCGKYKDELYRMDVVNRGMNEVHSDCMKTYAQKTQERKKDRKVEVKKEIKKKLYLSLGEQEFLIKLRQALVLEKYNDKEALWRPEDNHNAVMAGLEKQVKLK